MSTEIAVQNPQDERRTLIRETVAKGTSDLEFEFFMAVADRFGLDPLLRQIHAVMRKSHGEQRMTIQVGIDGYCLIAQRSKGFAGIDEVEFDSDTPKHPKWARVTVYSMVQGQRCPFTAKVYWDEYAPFYNDKLADMWEKMPRGQLGKCATSLALRRAFAQDLSGVYTNEEMQQADADGTPATIRVTEEAPKRIVESKPATKSAPSKALTAGDLLKAWCKDTGITAAALAEYAGRHGYTLTDAASQSAIWQGVKKHPDTLAEICLTQLAMTHEMHLPTLIAAMQHDPRLTKAGMTRLWEAYSSNPDDWDATFESDGIGVSDEEVAESEAQA